MKIKLLQRDEGLFQDAAKKGNLKQLFIHDKQINPLTRVVEYQRALAAAKVKRIFAKPFIHSFVGHTDAVKSIARCLMSTNDILSGSCDGEVRFWSVSEKRCVRSLRNVHNGFVNGICCSTDGKYVFSAGQDATIKMWSFQKHFEPKYTSSDPLDVSSESTNSNLLEDATYAYSTKKPTALKIYMGNSEFNSINYSYHEDQFLTSSNVVSLWDVNSSTPIRQFTWTNEGYLNAKFSPSDPNMIVATDYDNAINLIDLRVNEVVQKVVLTMKSNAVCFNQFRPAEFAVANDDSNVYAFDIRNFTKAKTIHAGFVGPALDCDYSPTGLEIAAGSFDQTIRIWPTGNRRAKEIYHNKRMQAVLQCKYSHDSKYIFSGSADMNIRVWKSDASSVNRIVSRREQSSLEYRDELINKFKHMPEISRIVDKRHVPKYILNKTRARHIQTTAEKEKEKHRLANNAKDAQHQPLHKSMIVKTAVKDIVKPKINLVDPEQLDVSEEDNDQESDIDLIDY